MGSSGSTPSPSPERAPRLLLVLEGDDDPKVCTGLRLVRFGRATRARDPFRLQPPPVVLDPHAPTVLSRADRAAARRGGLLAVDCSWNRLAESGRFPHHAGPRRRGAFARRLPYLLAANPQHYGRVGELNTVEALSAALYLLGYPAAAVSLLEGFRGGPAFLVVNRGALERFAAASCAEEVVAGERAIYGGAAPAGELPVTPPKPAGRADGGTGAERSRGARRQLL